MHAKKILEGASAWNNSSEAPSVNSVDRHVSRWADDEQRRPQHRYQVRVARTCTTVSCHVRYRFSIRAQRLPEGGARRAGPVAFRAVTRVS